MSTIHDALKKVQDDMGSHSQNQNADNQIPSKPHNPFNAPPPPPQEPVASEGQEEPSDPKINAQKIIGIIFIVIIIGGLGMAIYLLTNTGSQLMATFNGFKTGQRPPTTQQTQIPTFRASHEMRLKGIMTVGDKHVALFGDEIFKLNDEINGKRIIAITGKDITIIDEEGVEQTIKVSQ